MIHYLQEELVARWWHHSYTSAGQAGRGVGGPPACSLEHGDGLLGSQVGSPWFTLLPSKLVFAFQQCVNLFTKLHLSFYGSYSVNRERSVI